MHGEVEIRDNGSDRNKAIVLPEGATGRGIGVVEFNESGAVFNFDLVPKPDGRGWFLELRERVQ